MGTNRNRKKTTETLPSSAPREAVGYNGLPTSRRDFLAGAACVLLASAPPLRSQSVATKVRTVWKVRNSEGFDALCFLGPLSGDDFYAQYYGRELASFQSSLQPETRTAIKSLYQADRSQGGLLGPDLCMLFSGGTDESISSLLASLQSPDVSLKPSYQASKYWDETQWKIFLQVCQPLSMILADMQRAGFSAFWRKSLGGRSPNRIPQLQQHLSTVDVLSIDELLVGHRFPDPTVEIILLLFSQPHGIRIQGQRFLTYTGYQDDIVVRNAVHELLHPPFDPHSRDMAEVKEQLGRDPLLGRIMRERNPGFGYNTLADYLDEDSVQALEQIANEHLGLAQHPSERWAQSDGGMHILAAALYGLLKQDAYDRTGGNFQAWISRRSRTGGLAPSVLSASACAILKRPAAELWNPPKPT